MKRANGTGSIVKLSGNRRRPWAVRIPLPHPAGRDPAEVSILPRQGQRRPGRAGRVVPHPLLPGHRGHRLRPPTGL